MEFPCRKLRDFTIGTHDIIITARQELVDGWQVAAFIIQNKSETRTPRKMSAQH